MLESQIQQRSKKMKIVFGIIALFFLAGCGSNDNTADIPPVGNELTYTFTSGTEGWQGDFADYPLEREAIYEFAFKYTHLPFPLDENDGALMLSGNNHSDDLFMFLKKKIDGLEPNTPYRLNFTVEFASNVADGMIGVGGSPGEGVLVKVGATTQEPVKILDDSGWYRMSIDKGNQSNGGSDMVVIGDFSNDTDQNIYTLKTLHNDTPFIAKSNGDGELWCIVGTDSGFESTTTIYYSTIKVQISN